MVLRLLLIIILLMQPGALVACDPNFQPEEIFTYLHKPSLSPGILVFAVNLVLLPGLPLPESWESVIAADSGDGSDELEAQLLRVVLPVFGYMADKLRDNIAGRVILNTPPVVVRVARDGLQSGGWQTLVIQISLPTRAKVVIYQTTGKIEFIDEIDTTLNFSLTSAWPPVLFKHLRVWDHHGMLFSWPEEDSIVTEGVLTIQ